MVVKESDGKYAIESKVIVGVGVIAVVLMLYFAINMYQMVSHVGKLANNTAVMTQQMIILGDSIKQINKNTGDMSKDTHKMSSNIDSMDKGIKTVTTPTGWMNMWRR